MGTVDRFLLRLLVATGVIAATVCLAEARGGRVGVPVRGPARGNDHIYPKAPLLTPPAEESDEEEEDDSEDACADCDACADDCGDACADDCGDACSDEEGGDSDEDDGEEQSEPDRHRRGKKSIVDPYLIWPWWWEHNKDRFLARASERGRVKPGSASFWFGSGPKHWRRNIEPVPDSVRAGRVLEVLRRALRDRDMGVRAEACIALGRVGPLPVPENERKPGLPDDFGVRELVELLAGTRTTTPAAREVRTSAILGLGICGSEPARTALRRIFPSASRHERAYLCIALGLARDHESIGLLAARLPRSNRYPPKEDQLAAIHAFGLLGPDVVGHPDMTRHGVIPRLVKLASPSGREDVAIQAVATLARMGESLRTVKRACGARNRDLRWTAVLTLGHYVHGQETKKAASTLLAGKQGMGSSDPQVKIFALLTAGEAAGSLDQLDPVRRKVLLKTIRAHLEKVDVHTQPAATLALGLAKDRESIPAIVALLEKTSDSNIAGAACLSLGLLKANKHARLVKERVLHSHRYTPDARGYAALGLALMGDTGNLAELRAMRERSDVQFGAQRILPLALGVLGGRATNDNLIATFAKGWKRREVYVSSSAAFALGSIRDIGAVTELAKLIEESPNPDVRGMAVIALGYTASRDAVSPLTRCFTNISYRNRYRWRLLYEISMIL